jgi:hypothetical protein
MWFRSNKPLMQLLRGRRTIRKVTHSGRDERVLGPSHLPPTVVRSKLLPLSQCLPQGFEARERAFPKEGFTRAENHRLRTGLRVGAQHAEGAFPKELQECSWHSKYCFILRPITSLQISSSTITTMMSALIYGRWESYSTSWFQDCLHLMVKLKLKSSMLSPITNTPSMVKVVRLSSIDEGCESAAQGSNKASVGAGGPTPHLPANILTSMDDL